MIGRCRSVFSAIAAAAAQAIVDYTMVKRIFVTVPIIIVSMLASRVNAFGAPGAGSGHEAFLFYGSMIGNKNRPDVAESGRDN